MYLSLDIGGTNLKGALVTSEGEIVHKASIKAEAQSRTGEEILRACAKLLEDILRQTNTDKTKILGVGIGAPGVCDNLLGELRYATNLKFDQLPARKIMGECFDCPIAVLNDANAAALGEALKGTGSDYKSSVMITLGTGVGGGIIIDGKLYAGFNDAASELGHHIIKMDGELCSCGKHGCMEAYVSATALIRQTTRMIEQHPDSLLAELARKRGKVSGRTPFEALEKGCPYAKEVVDTYLRYLAVSIGNIINMLMPELIILGGGISHEGDHLLEPLRKLIPEYAFLTGVRAEPQIAVATLGNDAGLVGAALYAKDYAAHA